MGRIDFGGTNDPLVNGRPAMSVATVQQWCRDAKAPVLNDEAAAEIAKMLNTVLFEDFFWNPEFSSKRKANPNSQCLTRIAAALTVLRDDLPKALADSRKIGGPDADHSATELLLESVHRHQVIIDNFSPKKKGRPRDLSGNLAANIGKKFMELMGDSPAPSAQARDAFMCFAMNWLQAGPRNDEAVSKNFRRRTK